MLAQIQNTFHIYSVKIKFKFIDALMNAIRECVKLQIFMNVKWDTDQYSIENCSKNQITYRNRCKRIFWKFLAQFDKSSPWMFHCGKRSSPEPFEMRIPEIASFYKRNTAFGILEKTFEPSGRCGKYRGKRSRQREFFQAALG